MAFPKNVPLRVILASARINFLQYVVRKKNRAMILHDQNVILDYLAEELATILAKYETVVVTQSEMTIPRIIWIFWWQGGGIDAMNIVTSQCFKRLQKIQGYTINLVSENNFRNYVDLDDILPLFRSGYISIQHLSDITRFRILHKFGGIYCDASIYLNDLEYFDYIVSEYQFFSNKIEPYDITDNVVDGKCSTYFWATVKNHPFFAFLNECLTEFIVRHRGVINYTQSDFTIALGYRKVEFIKTVLDSIPPNNPDCWWLNSAFRNEFDKDIWNRKCLENHFFKLSTHGLEKKIKDLNPDTYGFKLFFSHNDL